LRGGRRAHSCCNRNEEALAQNRLLRLRRRGKIQKKEMSSGGARFGEKGKDTSLRGRGEREGDPEQGGQRNKREKKKHSK